MTARILVVEDDPRIIAATIRNLESAGFACTGAPDGPTALREIERAMPDLLLLDLMLPGVDGIEITRRLRRTGARLPILMLTARDGEADKVLGLEVGADDYLVKPFGMRELIARIRALLRRAAPDGAAEVLQRGDLVLDAGEQAVRHRGRALELTSLEFALLLFLARHPRRVYSREALMDHVWGEERIVDTRSIDSLVSRLRRKMAALPDCPEYVQTVWGAGYRFAESSAEGE